MIPTITEKDLYNLVKIYNLTFPEGTIPYNSIIYRNNEKGMAELISDHPNYSCEDIAPGMYSENDTFINICYAEGIVSFNLEDLIDCWIENLEE